MIPPGTTKTFVYNASSQSYRIDLAPGIYKIECWGASGGLSSKTVGGYGAYTSGVIYLYQHTTLYAVLGEQGQYSNAIEITYPRTFNGGGSGGCHQPTSDYGAGSGGGSTDIRLNYSGQWDDFVSLKSRIMVAAGGSGTTHYQSHYFAASGGRIEGNPGEYYNKHPGTITVSTGATQREGGMGCIGQYSSGSKGSFGEAGDWGDDHTASGGGGGYFGGGGGGISDDAHCCGSSGSSYISGFPNCQSIKKDATSDNPEVDDNPFHYSQLYFTHGKMIDGNDEMPSLTGLSQFHQAGSGAVRITNLFSTIHNTYPFVFVP